MSEKEKRQDGSEPPKPALDRWPEDVPEEDLFPQDDDEYGDVEAECAEPDPDAIFNKAACAADEILGPPEKMEGDSFLDKDGAEPERTAYPRINWKIAPAVLQRAKVMLQKFGIRSYGQLAEDALKFYMGYLLCAPARDYMSKVTASLIDGTLKARLNVINGVLYKLAVECATMSELCENHMGLSKEEIGTVREQAARRVRAADGSLETDGGDLWA